MGGYLILSLGGNLHNLSGEPNSDTGASLLMRDKHSAPPLYAAEIACLIIPARITPWSTSGSLFRSPCIAFKGANFLVLYIIHSVTLGQCDLKPKKKTLRRIVVWLNQKCQLSSGRKSWWLCCVGQCAQCALLCNVHNVENVHCCAMFTMCTQRHEQQSEILSNFNPQHPLRTIRNLIVKKLHEHYL